GFVKKTRAKVSDQSWFDALSEGRLPPSPKTFVKDYAYDFAYNVLSYQANPVVFTKYRRKAFFSTIDDYARVTFDKDLCFIPRDTYSFERSKDMMPYDNPNYFRQDTNVILELKCET